MKLFIETLFCALLPVLTALFVGHTTIEPNRITIAKPLSFLVCLVVLMCISAWLINLKPKP